MPDVVVISDWGSGDAVGGRAALSTGVTSAGGPIRDRITGRSTKPFSIPNTLGRSGSPHSPHQRSSYS
ncbi:hypothetical protein EYF80_055389 [Liparis tanakae]|uniref:Uncharacterized protein n=1 Tax=Liparis tanakae TaxID=230148 RepID=A0A4Z2F1T9_9TELE|nr:hypothetical protein EYF80_055389 [Liparis tanakae]